MHEGKSFVDYENFHKVQCIQCKMDQHWAHVKKQALFTGLTSKTQRSEVFHSGAANISLFW